MSPSGAGTWRSRKIGTTLEHPFFALGKGWTPAGELTIGDRIPGLNARESVSVRGVSETGRHEKVYNLRVADFHTYFVGGADWGFALWAHNACKTGPKTSPTAPHNATISALGKALEALGNTILAGGGKLKEKLIATLGGFKNARRPDILYQTPSGEIRAINVGRTTAGGTPVPREVRALADLNRTVPTTFVGYTP